MNIHFIIGYLTGSIGVGVVAVMLYRRLKDHANNMVEDLQDTIESMGVAETNLKRELRMARDAAQGKKEPGLHLSPKLLFPDVPDGTLIHPCTHIPITMINASSVPFTEELGIFQDPKAEWYVEQSMLYNLKQFVGGSIGSHGPKTRRVTLIRSE